jgi:hypothetical protein
MMGAKGDGGEALQECNALITIEDKRNILIAWLQRVQDASRDNKQCVKSVLYEEGGLRKLH